jgi:hypothetical protein
MSGAGGGTTAEAPCITSPAAQGAFIGDSYVTGFASPALQPALGALDSQALQFQNYGQKIIANEIWTKMKANCVGQPSSNTCCTQ